MPEQLTLIGTPCNLPRHDVTKTADPKSVFAAKTTNNPRTVKELKADRNGNLIDQYVREDRFRVWVELVDGTLWCHTHTFKSDDAAQAFAARVTKKGRINEECWHSAPQPQDTLEDTTGYNEVLIRDVKLSVTTGWATRNPVPGFKGPKPQIALVATLTDGERVVLKHRFSYTESGIAKAESTLTRILGVRRINLNHWVCLPYFV